MIPASAIRVSAAVVCVAGIIGMIAGSISNHEGFVLTCGVCTAIAVLCAMAATAAAAAAAAGEAGTAGFEADEHAEAGEAVAQRVEAGVAGLVDAGADEQAVRLLVGDAVRLGRAIH